MLRIGAGIAGVDVRAQQQVRNAIDNLTESGVRLATLKRINRGSDDPAGLIAAEKLNSELRAAEEASAAADRTRSMVRVADSGLMQANDLLSNVRENVLAAANGATSPAEQEALQMEVDAALEALDRLGHTTSFAGKKPLDGQPLEFLTGSDPSQTTSLQLPEVNSGSLGTQDGYLYELRSGGRASLDGDLAAAMEIVDGAQNTLLTGRATAGAFERYAVDSTQATLDATAVNLSEALSQYRDTDMAFETANFVQAQILADTSLMAVKFTNFARQTAANMLSTGLNVLA